MSVICIGGICIPYSVFLPIILLVLKPIFDFFQKLFFPKENITDKNDIKDKSCVKDVTLGKPIELNESDGQDIYDALLLKPKVILKFSAQWYV